MLVCIDITHGSFIENENARVVIRGFNAVYVLLT